MRFIPHHFILDVDDTLVDTEGAIVDIIWQDHGYRCPADTYLDPTNTGGHHAVVMAEAKFMKTAAVLPHARKLFDRMEEIVDAGHFMHICTHRGYHNDGLTHTRNLLEENRVSHLITDIHVLDFNTTPDKVAHLDAIYGQSQYWLFDDRPRFNQGHPLPANIWLFDRPWNQHIEGNRTTDIFDTIHFIMGAQAA